MGAPVGVDQQALAGADLVLGLVEFHRRQYQLEGGAVVVVTADQRHGLGCVVAAIIEDVGAIIKQHRHAAIDGRLAKQNLAEAFFAIGHILPLEIIADLDAGLGDTAQGRCTLDIVNLTALGAGAVLCITGGRGIECGSGLRCYFFTGEKLHADGLVGLFDIPAQGIEHGTEPARIFAGVDVTQLQQGRRPGGHTECPCVHIRTGTGGYRRTP